MMKTSIPKFVSYTFLLLTFSSHGFGQEKPADAIYIIFDASGSMWQKLPDGSFKIATAKQVLQDFVGGDFSGYELAFRAYGHRRKGDCRDSELVVPFGAPGKVVSQLQKFMANVNPTGKTPINYSLRQALADFGDRSGEIILISDGEETCDDDPCALVKAWQERNVKIRVHVVGLGLDEKSKAVVARTSNLSAETKDLLEIISVMPTKVEIELLRKLFTKVEDHIDHCINKAILVTENNLISFRHELARLAILNSVPEMKRIQLHQKVLNCLLEEDNQQALLARIVHHASQAGDKNAIMKYAPQAATQAALLGSHREAAANYLTALEYSENLSTEKKLELYEGRYNECYLTAQLNEAIRACEEIQKILEDLNDPQFNKTDLPN